MAPINSPGVLGKFYVFKSSRECRKEGISYERPKGRAAGHMAVCVTEPSEEDVVSVVTITSRDFDQRFEFIPLFRTSLQGPYGGEYATRLHFEDYPSSSVSPISSPSRSYLRLDPFEISLKMLKPVHPKLLISIDSYYDDGIARGDEWFRPNTEMLSEHLSLAPSSLHIVERRMMARFGWWWLKAWKQRAWPVSGEVNAGAGGGRARLARRMGWSASEVKTKCELEQRRMILLQRLAEEEEDGDEEMADAVSAPTQTVTEELDDVDAFLQGIADSM